MGFFSKLGVSSPWGCTRVLWRSTPAVDALNVKILSPSARSAWIMRAVMTAPLFSSATASAEFHLIFMGSPFKVYWGRRRSVSYTHLRAHETPEHLVCRLLLEKKKKKKT